MCEFCGAEFVPQRRASRGINRFCSRQCKDRARIGTPEQKAALIRSYYKRAYGLTPEEADAMRAEGCAICGATDGETVGRFARLHIDHCHDTGQVRGVLCTRCNTGLGLFQNDPDLLAKALLYLS